MIVSDVVMIESEPYSKLAGHIICSNMVDGLGPHLLLTNLTRSYLVVQRPRISSKCF